MQPLRIGIVVALISASAVLGPSLGLSPAWITVAVMATLVFVSVDAAVWSGRGGHLLAEALYLCRLVLAGGPFGHGLYGSLHIRAPMNRSVVPGVTGLIHHCLRQFVFHKLVHPARPAGFGRRIKGGRKAVRNAIRRCRGGPDSRHRADKIR